MTGDTVTARSIAAAFATAASICCGGSPAGAADAGDAAPAAGAGIAWKFTPTWYNSSNEPNAWDFNLRGNTDTQTWWAGYYQRGDEFQQLRLGYERPVEFSYGRIVPSLQYATRGFFGGSLYGEIVNFSDNNMVRVAVGIRF